MEQVDGLHWLRQPYGVGDTWYVRHEYQAHMANQAAYTLVQANLSPTL
jgi:hypothetical protein